MTTPLFPQEIYLLERYSSKEYFTLMRDAWEAMVKHADECLDEFMRRLPSDYRGRALPSQPDIAWGQRVLPNFRDTLQDLYESYIALSHGDTNSLNTAHRVANDFRGQLEFSSDWFDELTPKQGDKHSELLRTALRYSGNIWPTAGAYWSKTELTEGYDALSRGPLPALANWPKYKLSRTVSVKTGESVPQTGIYLPSSDDSTAQLLIAGDDADKANIGYDEHTMQNIGREPTTGLLKRRLEIQSRGRRQTIQTRGKRGRFGASKVALRVNRFAVAQIKAGLTPTQAAAEAAGAALRMNEWPQNDMQRFRTMFNTNARLAVIGLILQIVGAKSMATELDTSMSHKRAENNWRFRSSVAAIVGGVGNLIHDGIVAGGKAGNIRLAKAASTYWVEMLGVVSRGIGVVAAGIMAVKDASSAWREYQRGNVGMVWLYALSAATGLGAALLFGGAFGALIFGVSATGSGLILVAIGIAIALLIEFFKTDELQDWLERCLFGALDAGSRYQDLNEEMKQFGLAMKALGFKSDDETAPATTVPEH